MFPKMSYVYVSWVNFPFVYSRSYFLTVDAIIFNQACHNGRCYLVSSLVRMPRDSESPKPKIELDTSVNSEGDGSG